MANRKALDILGIAGDSFRTLFSNRPVLVFAIVGALVSTLVSYGLLSQVSSLGSPRAALSPNVLLPILLGIIITLLVNTFISAALISAVSIGGKMNRSVNNAAKRYLTLLGTMIALLIIFLCMGVIALLVLILLGLVSNLLVLLGLVLVVLAYIYVIVRLLLSAPVCVMSKKGIVDSIKSSWSMTRGRAWRIFWTVTIVGIAVGIVGGVATLLFKLAGIGTVGVFISSFMQYATTIAGVLIYQVLPKK